MTDQSSRPKELSLEGPLLTLKSVKYFLKIESPKDLPLLSPQARAFYKCLLLVSACFSLCASCCFSQVLCASCCFSLRLARLQEAAKSTKHLKMPAIRKKCPHNRQKHFCRECGGSGICEHNRIRSQCKSCGGSSICEHNRQRSRCKSCGGSSICEHNRQRSSCKSCGGSSICRHMRIKYRCKDCAAQAASAP